MQRKAGEAQYRLTPRPLSQGLLSWGPSPPLFSLPGSQKNANWAKAAGRARRRASLLPGSSDPCSALQSLGGDFRKLPLSFLPSLGSICGGTLFVLRYKKPLVMLFILEVPGVTDDTLMYRLVPKDSVCSLILLSPAVPSNWPALQSSGCLLNALN